MSQNPTEPSKVQQSIAYGQPQAAYGQPPSGYGQPQVAYGQQQGMYAQQQGVYGQQVVFQAQPVMFQSQAPVLINDPARDALVLKEREKYRMFTILGHVATLILFLSNFAVTLDFLF